jgi:hypothetical protein
VITHDLGPGSLRRKLNAGQQALLVLACLRKGETLASLAAGFGVSCFRNSSSAISATRKGTAPYELYVSVQAFQSSIKIWETF